MFYNKFISCLYMFRAPCAHHQEVKIVLYSLWYHHTYRCDGNNFDLLMMSTGCSKHVEARNKHIVKQKFCASSWLIPKINILRCTVSKTSKYIFV